MTRILHTGDWHLGADIEWTSRIDTQLVWATDDAAMTMRTASALCTGCAAMAALQQRSMS